jgi:hypothetical protein
VISTLLIAALFNPLHGRIQNDIDKRFYRRKYDAQKMMERFAASARQELEIEQLTENVLAIIAETVQPAHISIWLPDHPGWTGKRSAKPFLNKTGSR